MTDLQQQLDAELSQLIREYESDGLSSESIGESLQWHAELARSRTTGDRIRVRSDD